jgi:8-oxo-dGTP pyrophosphatase MutT (NUDIX family)
MHKNQISALQARLISELPGWKAQKILSPLQTDKYTLLNNNAKKAAVNLLLFPDSQDQLNLIYIKRPQHNPMDKHSGQISFPGGQVDESDNNYRETALRETYEEIGVIPQDIQVLGELSPLYVYVSNFFVQPVVTYIDYKPELILQESEVNYVIEEKVGYLQKDSNLSTIDYTIRGQVMKDMPYFKLKGEILWGATAMITSEFLQLVRELE